MTALENERRYQAAVAAELRPQRAALLGMEGFTPFRGRDLSCHRADVYRNLNEQARTGRRRWSIRGDDYTEDKLVAGHVDTVAVANARVHVNLKAQQRIADGGARSVHAWVTGDLVFCPTDLSPWYAHARRVTYDPRKSPLFWFVDSGEVFTGTSGNQVVRFDSRGMWAWP